MEVALIAEVLDDPNASCIAKSAHGHLRQREEGQAMPAMRAGRPISDHDSSAVGQDPSAKDLQPCHVPATEKAGGLPPTQAPKTECACGPG